jgi:NAD(P)-dependent dehydrogenase (short-subunit alcohol dehydrogenase family)
MSDADRRTAIVTGASRGIGAATALELGAAGINVVLTARSGSDLENVAESLMAQGGTAYVAIADARNEDDLTRVVAETVDIFGGIDILVNNAGVANGHPLSDATPEIWDLLMETNLRAPWLLSMLVYPHMKRGGGGAIVNLTSTSGLRADIGLGVYGISKAGVVMLTQVCAKEWARHGIRVNAVAPGLTETDLGAPFIEYLSSRGKPFSPLG